MVGGRPADRGQVPLRAWVYRYGVGYASRQASTVVFLAPFTAPVRNPPERPVTEIVTGLRGGVVLPAPYWQSRAG